MILLYNDNKMGNIFNEKDVGDFIEEVFKEIEESNNKPINTETGIIENDELDKGIIDQNPKYKKVQVYVQEQLYNRR